MLIPTWVPGEVVETGVYDNKGRGRPTASSSPPSGQSGFRKVGIPIVVTLAAVFGGLILGGLVVL